MPRGIAAAIAKWIALVWASTFALTFVMLLPTIWYIQHGAAEVRGALGTGNYVTAAEEATQLTLPANACRVALLMPAPYSLQFVPGVSHWAVAANRLCDVAYEVGSAAKLPSVQHVAELVTVGSGQKIELSRELVKAGTQALEDSRFYLEQALASVSELNDLQLPGGLGVRIGRVVKVWPPHRLQDVETLLGVANELLGFDRPRTYFVALQSEAEMRATGGFLGQFAVVRIANGKPEILHVGTNAQLQTPKEPGVQLLPGTDVLTLTDNPMAVNSNLSPHGPDVGALWLNLWKQQTGEQLDAAVALDVETSAQLVESAGKSLTKPDGTVLSDAKSMSDYAQNGVYFDFDGPDQAGDPRKAYQLAVFRDLLTHAASSIFTLDAMLEILPNAVSEGRVLLYFADTGLQQRVEESPIVKDLRQHPESLTVTWNNYSGNKFDFYIEPTMKLRCAAQGVELRLDVFANADPKAAYPAYIKQRLELPGETRPSVRDQWLFVLPAGSNVRWLSVDGGVARYDIVELGGRPVVQLLLDTVAGERHDVRIGLGGVTSVTGQVIGSVEQRLTC